MREYAFFQLFCRYTAWYPEYVRYISPERAFMDVCDVGLFLTTESGICPYYNYERIRS